MPDRPEIPPFKDPGKTTSRGSIDTPRLTDPPSWGILEMVLVLALFFLLPGWIRSALTFLPEEWRREHLAIRESDLPEELSFTKQKSPPHADRRPTRLRQTLDRVESSELFGKLRETAVRLKLFGNEEKDDKEKNVSAVGEKFRGEHPLTVLILVSRKIPSYHWILILVFVTGVVTAPLTEELIFRVVLMRGLLRCVPSVVFAVLTVFLAILKALGSAFRFPELSTASEELIAASEPSPIANPQSAAAITGASLIPSPAKATVLPSVFSSFTILSLSCGNKE